MMAARKRMMMMIMNITCRRIEMENHSRINHGMERTEGQRVRGSNASLLKD